MIATKAQIAALAALTGGRAIPATTPFDIEQQTTLGPIQVEHVDGRRWIIDAAGKTDRAPKIVRGPGWLEATVEIDQTVTVTRTEEQAR